MDADIDLSTLDHVRNDVGAANEAWVRHLSIQPGAVLLQRFRSITSERRVVLTAMSLDEIAATMGFVVGKLGKAPEGCRAVGGILSDSERTNVLVGVLVV